MNEKVFYAVVTAILVLGGIGIGVAYHASLGVPSTPSGSNGGTAQTAAVEPYALTLVITTQNYFNASAGDQPAYFVLQNNTLKSSANIVLPANVPIQLTIRNYDDGPASTAQQFSKVVGTQNDEVSVFNDTLVQSYAVDPTNTSASGIAITGGIVTNYVDNNSISHTFTIFSNTTHNVVVNIPVLPLTVEQTTFTLNQPGGYYWQCEAACGAGNSGFTGAMSTPGWMMGFVTVQNMSVANQPYTLNLLALPGQPWNSTTTQPAFIVVSNGGLHSTANISLPADTEIVINIFNFDDQGPLFQNSYANVTGTVGGKIFYLNDSSVNSSITGSATNPTGISVSGGVLAANMSVDAVSHTFTIQEGSSTTVNIPIGAQATVQSSFYVNQTGTFNWMCMDECGFGTNGMLGAMASQGWMMGTLYVY